MFTFVLYNSVFIPIDISFDINKHISQCVIDVCIDVLFITDMLLNLRTTYYDNDGNLVLEKRTIIKHYVCSYWFLIDIFAVFPFDIIVNQGWDCGRAADDGDDASSYAIFIKLLKALRLLRLMRFRKELDRLSGANALRVVVSLVFFVLVAHWLACVWWLVGYFEFMHDEQQAELAPPVHTAKP